MVSLPSRPRLYTALNLQKIHRGYFFENDMLINLKITGARAKDIPIPALYGDEESGINLFRVSITFPLLLLRRFFYRVYREYVLHDFSPIALFLFVGMSLCSWGVLFGSYHWISNAFARVATPTGTVMLFGPATEYWLSADPTSDCFRYSRNPQVRAAMPSTSLLDDSIYIGSLPR